jgi:hypothetical protein
MKTQITRSFDLLCTTVRNVKTLAKNRVVYLSGQTGEEKDQAVLQIKVKHTDDMIGAQFSVLLDHEGKDSYGAELVVSEFNDDGLTLLLNLRLTDSAKRPVYAQDHECFLGKPEAGRRYVKDIAIAFGNAVYEWVVLHHEPVAERLAYVTGDVMRVIQAEGQARRVRQPVASNVRSVVVKPNEEERRHVSTYHPAAGTFVPPEQGQQTPAGGAWSLLEPKVVSTAPADPPETPTPETQPPEQKASDSQQAS